ncbi:MAG: M1 family metallopeptidase [Acidobacteria bacterium]|nr:M1 family metallopeptidase [Acidobacteriota bacterium]
MTRKNSHFAVLLLLILPVLVLLNDGQEQEQVGQQGQIAQPTVQSEQTQTGQQTEPGEQTQPAEMKIKPNQAYWGPMTPIVKYNINAQLEPKAHKLIGTEVLTWFNTSEKQVDHLRFHLYYNAFRSEKTTLMKEDRYYKKTKKELSKLRFGEIRLTEIELTGGMRTEILTDKIRYISPDDNNEDDRTVMEIPLPEPVWPGRSITLKIEFVLAIPQIFYRTGQEDDYFFMGQWFPKIGVLQTNGQWHCHQFHLDSEFFADYGDYSVNITLPGKYVVGATGILVKTDKNVDGTITYTYEEKNIHDFAWTAYPWFKKHTEKFIPQGSKQEIQIEILLSPGHTNVLDRYIHSLKYALHFLAQHIYPYPYQKITVVDPPFKGIRSAGMEYPTLITAGYIRLIPDAVKYPEIVTIHEFLHQYWYGIIGSDEYREAWLDEGITTFFELEIMDQYFKDTPISTAVDLGLMRIETWETARVRYAMLLPGDNVNQYSWKFLNSAQYGANVYSKAGIFLRSLKNLVGQEKMFAFFKHYAEKYKYKHPTTANFIETFNNFMKEDFSWAFDIYINGDSKLDNEVYSVESVKVDESEGKQVYRNEVVFLRKEGYFPVDLLIKLADDREMKSTWKEKNKWHRLVSYDSSPIRYAAIDPDYKIPLDYNFLNNSRQLEPEKNFIRRLSLKFGFFFQNVMGFLVL